MAGVSGKPLTLSLPNVYGPLSLGAHLSQALQAASGPSLQSTEFYWSFTGRQRQFINLADFL